MMAIVKHEALLGAQRCGSCKDCEILEHYLELCKLHPPLREDVDRLQIAFTTNLAWALSEIGVV